MATINWYLIKYDPFYRKMIGDKELTPQEALKIFLDFLKRFKFIGTFHHFLNYKYSSFSQLYSTYFIERITHYTELCYVCGVKGESFYHWYDDDRLLFPFIYKDDDGFPAVWHRKKEYIRGLWEMYCDENKLRYSTIKINTNLLIKGDTIQPIEEEKIKLIKILEECGYFT